jgi:hypothetical protein
MDRLLTADEEDRLLDVLREFLRGRPGAMGNLRRVAKEILNRIDN